MAQPGWFAVSIGIGKVGSMPLLPGARLDAARFADWARSNGYETRLITDDSAPVTVEQLETSVAEILECHVERLIIFFSGHGTTLPQGDYWLVSDSESKFKAINVSASERAARSHPIEQIAFFADACRSTVPWAAKIQDRNLIGYPEHDDPRGARVDSFYATRVGSVAQEASNEIAAKTYGIFGKYVLQAINGETREAFESGRDPQAVSSQSLALWLERIIPLESGRIPGAVVQWPDVRPGWFRPNDWYFTRQERERPRGSSDDLVELAEEPMLVTKSLGGPRIFRRMGSGSARGKPAAGIGRGTRSPRPPGRPARTGGGGGDSAARRVRAAEKARDERVDEHRRIILESRGREGFETRQGLTVVGAGIEEAAGESGLLNEAFPEHGAWHVRTETGIPQSLAVRLSGGAWIGVTTLPGFVATVATMDSKPVSVNYVPAHFTDDYDQYRALGNDAAAAEWLALVASDKAVSPDKLNDFAERARQGKHANPTLGVLAAYAYDRAGAQDEIDSIAWYFADRNGFVPFDVALLSRARVARLGTVVQFRWKNESASAMVAGTFPMMTRGWALLEPGRDGVTPGLLELRPGLLPTPWTAFDSEHGAKLAGMIRSGALSGRKASEVAT
jgi:Caspase domain